MLFRSNTVSFGENVFGIEASSERYFSKKAEHLNIEESAVLVGLLKANNFYNPRLYPENARNRRNVVLGQMKKYNYLGDRETDSLYRLPLVLNYSDNGSSGAAGYFVYHVKDEAKQILLDLQTSSGAEWDIEEDGLIISTTLNLDLQNYATESFREHLSVMQIRLNDQYESASGNRFIGDMAGREMRKLKIEGRADEISLRQVFTWDGYLTDSISVEDSLRHNLKLLHAGLLAMDPETGAIRAWVGGIDFRTHPYDQVLARRQLASTFKPILYSLALEEGFDPCHYLDNDSVMLAEYKEWSPENFDRTYGGKYSLAGALVHSMNIPTFNLFLDVDFNRLDSLWRNMGFSFPLVNTPALAMGTAEASISELAIAYSSFANGGFRIKPYKIVSIRDRKSVV